MSDYESELERTIQALEKAKEDLKTERARGFEAAKRRSIAIVGQRMGYEQAERVIDAIRGMEED